MRLGYRLIPKRPFVVGGEFTWENMMAMPELQGMQYRANIANPIKDLPDGTDIEFLIT